MSPEAQKFRAEDAKAVLDNPIFKSAFSAVADYVEAKALACDPDNKEMAQRVILSKQILAAIKREIQRVIDNGAIAEIRIAELEKRRLPKLFRR